MRNHEFTATLLRKNSLRKECLELSIGDIEKVIEDLTEIKAGKLQEDEARKAAEAERMVAIKKIQEQMAAVGLSAADLEKMGGTASGTRPKVAAKYRLVVEDGKVYEWSGRGRTPIVFQQRIDNGASKEDFLIQE
ncbi:H-NS family nucleoid-associated regulatory protein [Marinobacterium rhizophilum]|uniref:H-NS histone family protein n=1 Tax=Marinobacterium rhizophilum TaxID=420402 RepID=UPI00036D444A|nr:H-NS family nucleoid-associated regulatory protein [Marinobacterium rhizophilum]